MSPKIAISINSSWNFVNFRASLIRALVANGFEVIGLAPPDEYSDRLAGLGCRFVPVPMERHGKSPLADLRLLCTYRHILRRERPVAFLGYTIKPNIYGSLAAHSLGIPVINNIAGLGETFLKRDWLNRLVRRLYHSSLRRSRVIFFQNAEQRDLFVREGIAQERATRLLPGSGVDLARFRPSERPLSRSDPAFSFLLVSRLLWTKGIGEYVGAARIVKASHPHARFQLLGLPEEGQPAAIPQKVLDGWVSEGAIEYLGATDDVRPFLEAADCIVLPSYYPEGTPRSLLEGAAMGKPLLTTDTPGCRDVVDHKVNGYLCAPRDMASLRGAMDWFLATSEEERAALRRASRAKAEREFDERIVIDRYLEAIKDIMPGRRRGDGLPRGDRSP